MSRRLSPPKRSSQSLPGPLNDTFRDMIHRAGSRCDAITDHAWITPDHISAMCDRRLRVAFIHEGICGPGLSVEGDARFDGGLLPARQA